MGLVLLLLACGDAADTGAAPADSDPADTDVDTDTSGDDDTDCARDTGLASFWHVGEVATSAGAYVNATFGYGFYGHGVEDWVCTVVGTLPYEGPGPEGCPDCDWAFDLGPLEGSLADGPHCGDFGFVDASLDGYFDYPWGFAERYYYDYAGTPLLLEDVLFLYVDGAWFAFAFNYGGRVWVEGDAEHVRFARPAVSSDGGYAWGYYDRCP